MARRGFTLIFTLLGLALVVSIAGFAMLYVFLGREPAVPGNAVLVLRVGGDLAEVASGDVVGYLRGARTPTVRAIVDNLRKAKVDSAHPRRAAEADRLRLAVLGQGPGDSRRGARIQEVRQAGVRPSRVPVAIASTTSPRPRTRSFCCPRAAST